MIVVYSEERARFEAITSYMERSIPKEERWRWDAGVKRWYARSEDIARRLVKYAEGTAALRLGALSEVDRTALADSSAKDADIEIPAPAGLAYLPYQRAGIAYALSRRNTLIADDMGLGKTIEAIGFINMLIDGGPDECFWKYTINNVSSRVMDRSGLFVGGTCAACPERVLIVTPASLRLNWMAEWRRWHTGKLRPVLLDTWPRGLFDATRGTAQIVSYDSVKKWHPMIVEVEWDVLILDEAHLIKDERARRTKTILGGKHKGQTFQPLQARRKLFLSGTPIVNRPAELWPLVKALAPDGLGANHADFTERYIVGHRLDELHLKLRSQIMVRRRKDDVLKELPAKRRQIVLLDVPDAAGLIAAEQSVVLAANAGLERARAEIAGLPHGEQVMRLRQCRAIAMSEMSRIRRESAIRKLPQAIEQIHDILGNVEKLVIFAHHLDVLDGLAQSFHRIAVTLDGRTELAARQAACDRFQGDRRVRVFIGGLRSAGLGITLTAASCVVFVELDWTPAMMTQAEDRLHRIGQHSPVLVQHLVVDGSIDSKMAKIILEKQAVMDAALDGGAQTRDRDVFREVMAA